MYGEREAIYITAQIHISLFPRSFLICVTNYTTEGRARGREGSIFVFSICRQIWFWSESAKVQIWKITDHWNGDFELCYAWASTSLISPSFELDLRLMLHWLSSCWSGCDFFVLVYSGGELQMSAVLGIVPVIVAWLYSEYLHYTKHYSVSSKAYVAWWYDTNHYLRLISYFDVSLCC